MAASRNPTFLRFKGQNTRRNLPRLSSGKRGESNFLRAFERAYLGTEAVGGFAGREFGVEGFGRADLIWMAWSHSGKSGDFSGLELRRVRVTAIEAKLSDWRKGLQQAYRYRYFANRALLVLPVATAANARIYLPTFRRLGVGVWSFDAKTGQIRKLFTPRVSPPLNRVARERALLFLRRALRSPLVAQTKPVRHESRQYVVNSSGRVKQRLFRQPQHSTAPPRSAHHGRHPAMLRDRHPGLIAR